MSYYSVGQDFKPVGLSLETEEKKQKYLKVIKWRKNVKKTNVLIFSAGEINSVELHDALSHNVNIEVFGASSIDRHGGYIFKNYRCDLPLITEECFIPRFNELIDEWEIDLIFPNHDTTALYLAEKQSLIHAKVAVSSYETALVCRDKKRIYNLFKDCYFCPEVYNDFSILPVFIKPREGQGTRGAKLVMTNEDIPQKFETNDYVITEYLPGKELSVDCLTDLHGNLCACYPRERIRTLAGICTAGKTVCATDEILEIARTLNERLAFTGLWFFQLKQDKYGKYKLLEFATRCASTMCLTRSRGVNLPLLSVYAFLGCDIEVFENEFEISMDRVMISRYQIDYEYDTVYIDYDDTIIERDKICLSAIRFLYQCINQNKRVVLLTRHDALNDDSLLYSLKTHRIPELLFDEIISLGKNEEKYEKISEHRSIFIDNAYAERKKVHDNCNIPVFDVEGIEVLLDWRV